MKEGTIGDMAILGITESFQVKRQVLLSAAEAAEVILRVDNIIKAAPRYKSPWHPYESLCETKSGSFIYLIITFKGTVNFQYCANI